MPALIPAVAYYRMSSDRQETSIDDQRAAVEQYAAANGYRLLREYADEGISGWKSAERLQFQELIEDAKGGDFKAVLCWDIDRFSRFDPLEANHYWYLLDRAGVQLASVGQGRLDWHDLGGWLSASVMQHGKAQYVKDIARNVCRGQRRAKIEDRKFLGNPPLGYARDENMRLVPGAAGQIALVRRIFAMRVAGDGYHRIASTLNSEGVPTPRGRSWSQQSIKHILKREAYIGQLVIGKESRAKFQKLVEEVVVIDKAHKPIIDRKTWDRVQEMFAERRTAHTRNGSEGARLGGLLRCGCCGGRMYTLARGQWRSYLCGTYHHQGECGWCSLPQAVVEAAIFGKIRERLLLGSRERLEAAIDAALAKRQPAAAPAVKAGDIKKLDRQIEAAAERLLIIDEDLLPEAQHRVRVLKERRAELVAMASPKARTHALPSAREIAAEAWRLDEIMREAPASAVRNALSRIIDHVRLDFEEHGTTAKRRRFRCTGGEIKLRSTTVGRGSETPSPAAPG